VVGIDLSGRSGEVLGAAAVMMAAVGYAAGPMILKRQLVSFDPLATVAASLWIAAVHLTPAGLLSAPDSVPAADAVVSVIVLGVVCTASGLRDPDGAGLGGRRRPRLDHHIRQPGGRGGARRDRARREPGCESDRPGFC
jgi:hypothetical protein